MTTQVIWGKVGPVWGPGTSKSLPVLGGGVKAEQRLPTDMFNPVWIRLKVISTDTLLPIQDVRIILYDISDNSIILSEQVDVNGEINKQVSYFNDVDFVGWAREQNLSGVDYVQQNLIGTITYLGLVLTIPLRPN